MKVEDLANEYKGGKQPVSIDEMSEAVKVVYIQTIINMAYDNDHVIDDKELAEILQLMTRLKLSIDSRFSLRAYMALQDELTPFKQLMSQLDAECPDGQIKSLHISLTKDMINLFFCAGGSSISDFVFFQKHRKLIKVTDDEIQLVVMAIQNDHNMLEDDVTDEQASSAMKALAAHAAAVGTPLAAVYLSGSVVGMSAAGITSGLSALGMAGLLGLSSMATGLGVVVLLGVGAYTGVRKITGTNKPASFTHRELMLHDVIKQLRSTISLVIQDINYITVKLNKYVQAHEIQDAQVKKLMNLMSQMTGAAVVLEGKSNAVLIRTTKLRCACHLDESKLKSLTHEPTKAQLYTLIRNSYEEQVLNQQKNGQKYEITKLVIKQGYTVKDIENLASAFETIGYFSDTNRAQCTTADVACKTKSKLAGLLS